MATKFMKIKCSKCGEERKVFSHSNKDIYCEKCKAHLVQPKGGKAQLVDAETIEEYDG